MRIERHRRMRAEKALRPLSATRHNGLTLPAAEPCCWNASATSAPTRYSTRRARGSAEDAILCGIDHLARSAAPHRCHKRRGADGGGYGELTMRYVDALGELNARLASRFDRVLELVCGIPLH
jgi:adenosylcobinamide kinase/adenosylcobinamide-phosphate guanylyltransferase